jgi:hypothetical protein
MSENVLIEDSVYKIPLILSKSLNQHRETFEQIIFDAQKRLRTFAIQNGWSNLVKESFADRVEIYDDKIKFDQRLLRLMNEDLSTILPKTFSAALENRILVIVSPELYNQNYPEGIEKNNFQKLITHEMAHRLHIRILNNNENTMGPTWFFEGFALYAARQLENYNLKLDHSELLEIIRSTKRESYKKYVAVFRYFLGKTTLTELLKHSANEKFNAWLENLIVKNQTKYKV